MPAVFTEVDEPHLNSITICSPGLRVPASVRSALIDAQARDNEPSRKIEVSPDAPLTLPAAVRLRAALKRCKPDTYGFVSARGPTLFWVRQVTPDNVDRLVRIVQALLVAADARGFATKAGEKDLVLSVQGEPVVLACKERSDLIRLRPVSSPRLDWRTRRIDYKPTGRLSLEIDAGYYSHGARRRWQDTADRKLETKLSDVLAGLVVYVLALRDSRETQKREADRWQQQWQRDEESRKLAERERARVDFLAQRLRAVDDMQKLDRYLALLGASEPHTDALSPSYQFFMQWVRSHAQRLQQACSAQTLEALLANERLFAPDQSERLQLVDSQALSCKPSVDVVSQPANLVTGRLAQVATKQKARVRMATRGELRMPNIKGRLAKTVITLRIPPNDLRRLDRLASMQQRTRTSLINQFIAEGLKREERKSREPAPVGDRGFE
jgi:hypothetical protein